MGKEPEYLTDNELQVKAIKETLTLKLMIKSLVELLDEKEIISKEEYNNKYRDIYEKHEAETLSDFITKQE